MRLTIGAAKALGCPLALANGTTAACLADECPMWRWTREPSISTLTQVRHDAREGFDKIYKPGVQPPNLEYFDVPYGNGWTATESPRWDVNVGYPSPGTWVQEWSREKDTECNGYCGLGGKAEY